MKKRQTLKLGAGILAGSMLLTGASTAAFAQEQTDIDKATWFSDVSFWTPPTKWDLSEDSVTGGITKATGLEFEMNIPAEDGATKLALMIVSGNLPDVISITDTTLMKELTESDLVWDLDEFLNLYDPESPLINGNYPEDIKKDQIARDGAWYAYASHQNSEDTREIYPPNSDYYSWSVQYGENYGILWNDTVMEEFGLTLEDLQTEEQVLAAFEMVKNTDKTVDGASYIPILVDGNSYQECTLRSLEYFFGSMPIDDEGNYQDWIQAPESKHALEFLNTLVRNGYLDPNQFTIDNAGVKSYIASGRVLYRLQNHYCNCCINLDHLYVRLWFFKTLSDRKTILCGSRIYQYVLQWRYYRFLYADELAEVVQHLLGVYYSFAIWRFLQCYHLQHEFQSNSGFSVRICENGRCQ